jgi:propanol-preferring alcohol dehydrogenase
MVETMKAAVVHEYGKPLVIEEVPVPEVRPGRILVKVEACGVCHTDLHAAEGKVKVHFAPDTLDNINGIFERMKVGHIDGRIVMKIA